MKHIFTIAVFGMVLGAHAANPIDGSYNTSLGWIAGLNANGEKATAVGAAAAAEATGITRTDFVGAGAGSYSDGLTDCVGIGFRSLAFGTNMNSVVGIGRDAFLGRKGLSKATWLNGQFVAYGQNNSFLLKGNPNIADTNAPIRYADGVLTLQADRIVVKGETTDGEGFAGLESPLSGYDLYVDPVNGDDSFVGTSSTTAKRTIDAAYAAVTNHDMTICLLPGEYASPSIDSMSGGDVYPTFRVHLISPYGAEQVVLDGGNARGYWGCELLFSTVRNCTLRNFRHPKMHRPMFSCVRFSNCKIELSFTVENCLKDCGFDECVIEQCELTGSVAVGGSWQKPSDGFLKRSDIFDSVIVLSAPNAGYEPYLLSGAYLENSYLYVESVNAFSSSGNVSVFGNSQKAVDSTLICGSAKNFTVPECVGSLLGLGDITNSIPIYGVVTGSVCTNAAAVLASIQSDHRPSVRDWEFRFAGYNSAADRSVRNSMENSILSGLMVNETLALPVAAKMSLLGVIEENETVDAPRTANHPTEVLGSIKANGYEKDPSEEE